MNPGTLVSYWLSTGTRHGRLEGVGTIKSIDGSKATIRTLDGVVRVHVGNLQIEPTAAEIRERCEIIQATWSDEERDRRRRHYAGDRNRAAPMVDAPHLLVPTIREADLDLAG